ncbi:hypothetical protein DTO271D3_6736 [Paecilomyces variotii]|nr:hypothetical protein DTO207G8_2540 [Paecilomyces variotii]KAJ9270905.1 hypothetical protein DTO212C5_3130 [Paecilomyces variotii]KAJ9306839.1 hypothetical protein DTO217A2_3620 [Paecilomyces variotii]KAJ9312976.1 hypothetical protein DTO271D3_6736 [Paecilomyces variotii]KAJ9324284.1 hypothetical protein DTO027B3_4570 [Paecilomyces variotii]
MSAEIYYLPSGCNCDGTGYTRTDIQNAADKALSLASQHQTLGRDKYPHAYNDYEHFSFKHAQKPYLEFPIERNGKTYDGGSPGADRVVIGSIAEDYSSAVFCAVITHDGSTNNGFTECQDDTMNVRGKGKYEPSESEYDKKHHHHHRKLLDRIDL